MSSMNRTIAGDALVLHLREDLQTIDPARVAEHGRGARTLIKDGPLRLTLVSVGAGGTIPAHRADGPVTVHVIQGDVVFTARGREHPLAADDVLVLGAGVEHDARSANGAVFLLTVVTPAGLLSGPP